MKKPNVILVLTDDQGYGDLGCTGNPWINTKNIDNFYENSLRFSNYHVGPTCAPTRAGLMTGLYANSAGVWHTIGGRSLLRRDKSTLAQLMGDNGYETGIFGKWHLGDTYPYRAMDRGFKKSIVHGGGGISQTPDYWGNDYFDDTYFVDGTPKKFKGYCTDVFFQEGIKFIEQNKEKPFLCCITTNAPHSPYNVERRYAEPYLDTQSDDRARFYGMITNIDENFGRLISKLKEFEIEDNTILIFMTDNGTSGGACVDLEGHLIDGYNASRRGVKNSEYDGGHRVPFFIRWPQGGIKCGRDIGELTANIDFMPTILDLCSITPPSSLEIDGMSLKNLIYDKGEVEDRVIVTDSQRLAYPVKWRKSSTMTRDYRLINGRELYNIKEDPKQIKDISFDNPKLVKKLRNEYEKWWKIVSTQFDEDIPLFLGETPISITSHDLRNEECNVAWHQGMIRSGYQVKGYYEIFVEDDGDYEFTLNRWPSTQNKSVLDPIFEGEDDFNKKDIQEKNWHLYSSGVSLPLIRANISIQGTLMKKEIQPLDKEVKMILPLKKGSTTLKAWFSSELEESYTSCYYIHCKKIN